MLNMPKGFWSTTIAIWWWAYVLRLCTGKARERVMVHIFNLQIERHTMLASTFYA